MDEVEITYKGAELLVFGVYEKGSSGRWSHSNGDPGYDGYGPEFRIKTVKNQEGVDITEFLKEEDFSQIEQIILAVYED